MEGYEGIYEVSSLGQVKRLPGYSERIHKGKVVRQPIAERILKPSGQYPQVGLCVDGKVSHHYCHHLVAQTFIGERGVGQQVCHNNGQSLDPSSNNLRYDSPTGNASDRHLHGTDAVGESNPSAKLTERDVKDIYNLLEVHTQEHVAELYGLKRSSVASIAQKRRWTHVEPEDDLLWVHIL